MFGHSTNTVAPVITIHAKFGATETSYFRDEEIHAQGERASRIFKVVRGAARGCKLLSDGRRQICAFHLPNDFFGWENGPSYRFTAEAIVDTTVLVVSRQTLEYVAATDIRVTHTLLNMATKNLEHAENRMTLLGQKNSLEKIANFLLEMDRRLSASGMLALPMTRRDIADYLGLTVETVSRDLSQLRVLGILKFGETSQRQIVLQDRQRLRGLDP